jgi:DNA helicase II / ATP-dependent DNA helicase PcrA
MSSLLDDILPPEPLKPEPQWSEMQQAVFKQVKTPETNILIQAVAGSGKTTTIIEALKYAPGSSLFMAFNKAIAEDIRRKATAGEVKTLNALGHGLMMANRPGARLNARKVLEIIKKVMGDSGEFKEHGYTLSRVVGLAKNCAFGLDGQPGTQHFIDLIDAYAFDIPVDLLEVAAFVCREAFEQSRLDCESFDFDDQLWVPLYERWTFPLFANVFVDEAQDLSPIQHLMVEALVEAGALAGTRTRVVAVGDRHQAIYGFRGASHQSMDQLKRLFNMKELPLSISYRCAQSVVLAAQDFCPEIRWREGAPQGDVLWRETDPQAAKDWAEYMILCRTNAPLFTEILRCVREQEPCQVLSSFLDSFQGFIRGLKTTYTSDLMTKLDHWYEREREAALAKGKKGKLQGIVDRYETIKLLCGEFKYTADMVNMVRALGESTRGPIFATIHKSKGLEHQHVYILRPDLLGGFGELTKEQVQQEDNLHYVAITRTEETLTYGAGKGR